VGDWKIVSASLDAPWELYDLTTDRCESNDLAKQHPEKVREMSAMWEKCEKDFREQAGPADPPTKPAKAADGGGPNRAAATATVAAVTAAAVPARSNPPSPVAAGTPLLQNSRSLGVSER
jgi:hypothetical protein